MLIWPHGKPNGFAVPDEKARPFAIRIHAVWHCIGIWFSNEMECMGSGGDSKQQAHRSAMVGAV
jgi:hypothetical protein